MNSYKTISGIVEGSYKEKGSKFLSFAYPVDSLDEVGKHIDALKRKYYDARHHCYAYMLGMGEQDFRANDDGEPTHSAGDPILGQIRSYELTNVLVVVVRYFGGIKLGVGGLINAYKTATSNALKSAHIIRTYPQIAFNVRFSYAATSEIERLLSQFHIHYDQKTYEEDCIYEGRIRESEFSILMKEASLLAEVEVTKVDL